MRRRKGPTGPQHTCLRCGHVWFGKTEDRPNFCPKCRSKLWDQPRPRSFTCHVCGHVWESRNEEPPTKCPKCRSLKWKVPRYRLQCLRCGYRWVPRNRGSSLEVRMCPRCKSRYWNRVPIVSRCTICGKYYINDRSSESSRCPSCRSRGEAVSFTCPFCKAAWTSKRDTWAVCPVCGSPHPEAGGDDTVELWSEEERYLVYSSNEGTAVVYLWKDGKPLTAKYLSEVLEWTGMDAGDMVSMIGRPECAASWIRIADWMYMERDRYTENISYLRDLLHLEREDAVILAMHFTGMGPEAIALRLDISYDSVREAFDRIMDAYSERGIMVDDTVYTDDPVSEYR